MKGAGKVGKEFSRSTEVMERGRHDEKESTVGRGEFSIVGISLLKPAKLIYCQGLIWFVLLLQPHGR